MKKIRYNYKCISCGKVDLEKNEVAICMKLLGENVEQYYCLDCLAEYLEVEPQDILNKIEEFKEDGCELFE
jgi:biotin operon repressor